MQISQIKWSEQTGWSRVAMPDQVSLLLVTGDHQYFSTPACFQELRELFPGASIAGCSSAGTIMGPAISDGDMVATAVTLEKSRVKIGRASLEEFSDISALGETLARQLAGPELKHILVFSDGLLINGSELASGLSLAGVPVTGGLAGDGKRFQQTHVMGNAPACSGLVVAVGFYGQISVQSGCFAGWEEFGAERLVSRSEGNIVYEIDGQPALALYKNYLAEQASQLPASGLRFPLSVWQSDSGNSLIRTMLAIDEKNQSITFAGDVPQGYKCRLMKTNIDKLIESAGLAAAMAKPGERSGISLSFVVSCIGRRLVLGQLAEEELEIILEKLGPNTVLAGFYSYGELASLGKKLPCQLHNQTMTLTNFYE